MEIHNIGPALWRSEEQPKVFQSETFAYNDFDERDKFCVVYLIVRWTFTTDGSCMLIAICEPASPSA